MTSTNNLPPASYDLPLPVTRLPAGSGPGPSWLSEPLLLGNVLWFCRLRWVVVGILGTFGILGLFPTTLNAVGLQSTGGWPLVAAAVLALGNIGFQVVGRTGRRPAGASYARLNLWSQILFDLMILTGVVHFVGSLETTLSFAYLFHIVLACIFLSRRESLLVTLLASGLFAACVAAELMGIPSPHPLYAAAPASDTFAQAPWPAVWNSGLALGIWLTVWYLACHLSAMVQDRDRQLAETNRRLEAAVEERSKHMLRTTHELKAPFAAIDASSQVLLNGQCGALPEEALVFIRRISARCRRLAGEIQEMVQLANLRSESQGPLPKIALEIAELLNGCIAQVLPLAEQRKVRFETRVALAWAWGVEDHLKMLFSNLLCNAVIYSHEGGAVEVRCTPAEPGGAEIDIEDHGIGIPAEKLPRIFEEYYRTDEAVRHNKQSSGLGLAIVRHVAETHGIRIRVESRPGVGTTFKVTLPFSP